MVWERYSPNHEHGVIWESRDWGFMGGNSLLRQSPSQHLKSSNACVQEGHRIEDLIEAQKWPPIDVISNYLDILQDIYSQGTGISPY